MRGFYYKYRGRGGELPEPLTFRVMRAAVCVVRKTNTTIPAITIEGNISCSEVRSAENEDEIVVVGLAQWCRGSLHPVMAYYSIREVAIISCQCGMDAFDWANRQLARSEA